MTTYSEAGKGSARRPQAVSNQEYADRWDAIFARERAERALEELVRINEELGLYDDYDKPTRSNNETQAVYNQELDKGTHYN